ncbi:hypothetical protein FF1_045163 [Malus domestica]
MSERGSEDHMEISHRRDLYNFENTNCIWNSSATPKQIRELMKVDGLTNDEGKSHLQRFVFLLRHRIIMFSLEESTARAFGDYHLQSAIEEPSELSMQNRLGEEQERGLWVFRMNIT